MAINPEATILVRYVRNAENSVGTAALSFIDDDRPELSIGQAGYVTEQELHAAAAHGVVLEPTDVAKLQELNIPVPADPSQESGEDGDVLDESLPMKDLQQIAKDEGVDVKGLTKKSDVVDAIKESRLESAQGSGESSLPATATAGGPPTPLTGGGATGSASDTGGVSAPAGDLGGPTTTAGAAS